MSTERKENFNSSLPVLSQSKGILIDLLAKLADEISDPVFNLGQLGFGLLGDLNNVELRVNVAYEKKEKT